MINIKNRDPNKIKIDKSFMLSMIFIIFSDFLMFYQIFLSPQEKRSTLTICKTSYGLGSQEIRKDQENSQNLTEL